jgi:hypothetical protein
MLGEGSSGGLLLLAAYNPYTAIISLRHVCLPWKSLKIPWNPCGLFTVILPPVLARTCGGNIHPWPAAFYSPRLPIFPLIHWDSCFLLNPWNAKVFAFKLSCEFQIWNSQVKHRVFLSPSIFAVPSLSPGCKCWMLKCLPGETWVGRKNEGLQGMRMLLKISKHVSATLLLLYLSSIPFQPHGAELQIDLLQGWSIWGWFLFWRVVGKVKEKKN